MSRVYWHSRERTVELLGSERAHLGHVANGPAEAAWDLNTMTAAVERAAAILKLVPESDRDYLHAYLQAAEAAEEANRRYYETPESQRVGRPDFEAGKRLVSSLAVSLRVNGMPIEVAGQRLHTDNVALNTALVAGSDPVRLAAKIHGWCESHCWVDEPDQEWLASVVDEGLRSGIFRAGMWYETALGEERKWSSQGWEDVLDLLRADGTGPVVMSYSVCDSFPNQHIAGWEPPEDDEDAWYDLPSDEQWDLAFAGLSSSRPWARLSEGTLSEVHFHLPVSIYDLFAPDRDERVARAAGWLPPAVD